MLSQPVIIITHQTLITATMGHVPDWLHHNRNRRVWCHRCIVCSSKWPDGISMCPHWSYRPSWSTLDCMQHEISNLRGDPRRCTNDWPMRNRDRPTNSLAHEMCLAHFRHRVERNLGTWTVRRQWNDWCSVVWWTSQWRLAIHEPSERKKSENNQYSLSTCWSNDGDGNLPAFPRIRNVDSIPIRCIRSVFGKGYAFEPWVHQR